MTGWLPITKKEVDARGWDELDIILISGDAYVDHPSFGHAVIGRVLESEGLRVAIIPQPNWQDDLRDFKKMGKPRLFFGISSGCMDPMVNHYTATKRLRSTDAYTPGGKAGFRPDYAATVYSKILKKLFPDVPVIIGGIEASLRRVTHYDYWSDQLKPSILVDSGADLLIYGMGEQPLREIARLLVKGVPFSSLKTISQTAFLQSQSEPLPKNKKWETFELASHESCITSKRTFAQNFKYIEQESNRCNTKRLAQNVGSRTLVINPPYKTMTEKEIDASFALPYTRLPHPKYKKRGAIPAFEMIRFSINLHRGCFGGCSFCTISEHQGKFISSRSKSSIMYEVEQVVRMPDFKGYISDLGGPSANMYMMSGKDPSTCDKCTRPSCIYPAICNNLDTNHKPLIDIYKSVSAHPKVKKAFVGSGIRHDMLITKNREESKLNHYDEYTETLIKHHVSGRLKVAPEHTSEDVLKIMRKPPFKTFQAFKLKFDQICKKAGLKQQLIPYFISSHPGSEITDMANLALETKKLGYKLEQIQDFTPTPMTLSSVIYYSEYHPYTMKKVYTAVSVPDKKDQRRFFFWYKKENRQLIRKTLAHLNKSDIADKLLGKLTK
ncbi:MAG: YgiQ family radical SAM protein [Desulfobacterales bacterium]|nr:YgiQ family radical SAM protein [Desulfobacterales bacterium]